MSTVIHLGNELTGAAPVQTDPDNWKEDVARRVAAHRGRTTRNYVTSAASRSNGSQTHVMTPEAPESEERRRTARIAAAVAARYAAAPSYQEVLSSPATLSLFDDYESDVAVAEEPAAMLQVALPPAAVPAEMTAPEAAAAPEISAAATDIAEAAKKPSGSVSEDEVMMAAAAVAAPRPRIELLPSPPESLAPELLPVRVIDSPRELIAVRRMRPRLSEAAPEPNSQLRIFEVDHDQVSTTPEPPPPMPLARVFGLEDEGDAARQYPVRAPMPAPVAHEVVRWELEQELPNAHPLHATAAQGMYESPAAAEVAETPLVWETAGPSRLQPGMRPCDRAATIVIQSAPIEMRLMSMLVDLCMVSGLALVGLLVYCIYAAHPAAILTPTRPMLLIGGAAFIVLWLAYQVVSFATKGSTPGMRYARIGLCTFDDENPTRLAMCGRALAQMLSLSPLGLGCLWTLMDMDGLSWHDRITHIYQRSY